MEAGKHEALVNFFENDGAAVCVVTWSGPDTKNTEVPPPSPACPIPSSHQTSGPIVCER